VLQRSDSHDLFVSTEPGKRCWEKLEMELMRSIAIQWSHRGLLLFPLLLIAFALPVFATLGADVSSVQSDRAHMKATVNVSRAANFSVHEMKAAGGTAVREFVSPSGQVFGVAWSGPFQPDLKQVLGSYYDQFVAAAKNRRASHNAPISIQQPGLVVEMSGHMRYYVGRAYVPGMLPQGVQTTQIK
jgi:Protein of unknown function (DUF2844)